VNSRKMLINYGYKPFWFWNGDMDDSEIKRQVREMADKGVGGFLYILGRALLSLICRANGFIKYLWL